MSTSGPTRPTGGEEAAGRENVFLFLPNLIGYSRIVLAAVSLHFMSYHPIYCTIAYIISQLLDAVDGQVARWLGQTTHWYDQPLMKSAEVFWRPTGWMSRGGLQSITWPQLVAILTFPICAGKQIINVVQFWKASKSIVESDLEDRAQTRLASKPKLS